MKKIINILVLGALMAYLIPAYAQNFTSQSTQPQQEWKTSTMQTSGSAYSSQVTAVGATSAASQATTTYTSLPGGGPRKTGSFDDAPEGGEGDEGSPIGDAVLPLLLLAMVYSAVRVYRRRRV